MWGFAVVSYVLLLSFKISPKQTKTSKHWRNAANQIPELKGFPWVHSSSSPCKELPSIHSSFRRYFIEVFNVELSYVSCDKTAEKLFYCNLYFVKLRNSYFNKLLSVFWLLQHTYSNNKPVACGMFYPISICSVVSFVAFISYVLCTDKMRFFNTYFILRF